MTTLTLRDVQEMRTSELIKQIIDIELVICKVVHTPSEYRKELEFNDILLCSELNKRIPNG